MDRLAHSSIERLRLLAQGRVQGVGFRPTVYRVARSLGLTGWVRNSCQGALIEIEGHRTTDFAPRLLECLPEQAHVEQLTSIVLPPRGERSFRIGPSLEDGGSGAQITPDLATCKDCLKELLDPSDRRYRYPFLNCTQCGPRFSILRSLPYDRGRTSMAKFTMCRRCQREYDDPADRRFHAQPNACPDCGPQLDRDLELAVQALAEGKLVALKGLGGFHLLADPSRESSVKRLREVKGRPSKSLALMMTCPEQAKQYCQVNSLEEQALRSAAAPIVLLKTLGRTSLSQLAAPDSPALGVMLPYTPVHHLLMREFGRPLIATSANRKNDPIPTAQISAGLADFILDHNRPIVRGIDDSIVWVVADQVRVLRLARGYAPLLLPGLHTEKNLLAVGGHQKSSVTTQQHGSLTVGPHLGDLEGIEAVSNFEQRAEELCRLQRSQPKSLVIDHHPDYVSSRWAQGRPCTRVWHHHAHLASCLLDNGLDEPTLGVIWDGSGVGPDRTVWGGEFLVGDRRDFRRVHHWTPYPLLGGEAAVREPRRIALALTQHLGQRVSLPFTPQERRVLERLESPLTSSTGRLFDALASLLGLCHKAEYEGQGAIQLESVADPHESRAYEGQDWPRAFTQILEDISGGVRPELISARFHNWLVEVIVHVARSQGLPKVALSGGCFQNRRLLETSYRRLLHEGFQPLLHRQIPPNDGGLSAGQAAIACA